LHVDAAAASDGKDTSLDEKSSEHACMVAEQMLCEGHLYLTTKDWATCSPVQGLLHGNM